jgi:hypothetical protein
MSKMMTGVLLLLWSIPGILYAQDNDNTTQDNAYTRYKNLSAEDRLFSLPPNSIDIDYRVELNKKNVMLLQMTATSHLHRFENIDSILLVFLGDMKAFKDSLSDPMTIKRIDYLIDTSGQKKLRIRQSRPASPTFLLDGSEPALLRLQQDTIFIMMATRPGDSHAGNNEVRYDRLGFFLNRYEELEGYVTSGLNDKVRLILKKEGNDKWETRDGRDYLVSDPSISSRAHTRSEHTRNFLDISGGILLENYKSYFVPSFSVGATIGTTRGPSTYAFGARWEPLFIFVPDAQGRLQTYRNDFLVLNFSHRRIDGRGDNLLQPYFNIGSNLSLGYLIHSQGDYMVKHTFRLTIGESSLFKSSLKLQPCLFFNDFFKGVTPGIVLSFGGI